MGWLQGLFGRKDRTNELSSRKEIRSEESLTPLSVPSFSPEQLDQIDQRYCYLDLEVDPQENTIYQVGLVAPKLAENLSRQDFGRLGEQLFSLKHNGLAICGHNFRRFDYLYLTKLQSEFYPWQIIDTLELSVIVKPLQHCHRLTKQYKLSQYTGNNPLEDARATQVLLHSLVEEFFHKPPILQQIYAGLLTCGTEEADEAYKQFFQILGFPSKVPPLKAWTKEAIAGFDHAYLQTFIKNVANQSFDCRLCLAALMAWNYESQITGSTVAFPRWLTYLSGFPDILNNLRPLMPDGFTYHPYLEEFGIQNFRGQQEESVQAILEGRNPLVVMQTGGGKSLCYQLSALVLYERHRALTVVISPLQALMADQVADLKAVGLSFATYINGTLNPRERPIRLRKLYEGLKGLLYISPEQLRSNSIRTLLQERPPALWVIDEAHCISEWGQSFRPDYRYIPKFIQELYEQRQLPLPRLALMTATATARVREDIKKLFTSYQLSIGCEIISSHLRSNLEYEVISASGRNKEQLLINQVRKAQEQGGCTLVYTTKRKSAKMLSTLLNQDNIHARYFHAGISKADKEDILDAFKRGELNVVVATCAFGMGINRKDVRQVIHHTISNSLESYVQESGRAGRDGQPARCTILFDESDSEPIFFLQGINKLSQIELENIFIATRNMRERIYGKASEDWFWVTPHEIFHGSSSGDELEPEQRDIKVKLALHHLENFGMLERAENLSSLIKFQLLNQNTKESYCQFEKYSQQQNLPESQVEQFKRLISAMHAIKTRSSDQEEHFPQELLSDEVGIAPQELRKRIHELELAQVCSFEIPLSVQITKGVRGDARNAHENLRTMEKIFLDELLLIKGEGENVKVNLRGLASRLDPDRNQKINASALKDILEGWISEGWVNANYISSDLVDIFKIEVEENLERQKTLASTVIEVFYQKLGKSTGSKQRVEYPMGQLLKDVNVQTQPLYWSSQELESILLWFHERKLIRLTEGLNLFQQAFKVRVKKSVSIAKISREYSNLEAFYQEQARRTHIMMEYCFISDNQARQQLVEDYFNQPSNEFERLYPNLATEEVKRPVTQDDYNRIMGSLNPTQREVVLAQEPALAVIAGPGSGKTRTIVHRIAYLVKVKRVEPSQILVLAYNRNAVRELRVRLQALIGSLASRLRVFTFHGLALALLGRSLGQQQREQLSVDFSVLLQEACRLFDQGDDSEVEVEDIDAQARRVRLLGNLEYIFVDEYQDVAEDEYCLIQKIAGFGDSESRSVQINLCVIGDDDQNIYEFRGTSPEYIIQFEAEYQAKQLLLTENYRSTQPIIEAANNLICHNTQRCKKIPSEQVRINTERQGQGGIPVNAFSFRDRNALSSWVTQKIQSWISEGVQPNDIAILAREWDNLSPIRLLLEKNNISTYALKKDGIKLVRNWVTSHLINALRKKPGLVLDATESVESRFRDFFQRLQRNLLEPTVKVLLRIAKDIDQERGYGSEDLAPIPISADEIVTAIFEFSASGETFIEENSVLVTSCHGAKGLEFSKVILLTDNFKTDEGERRLFYVAMTRAKEELLLCSTNSSKFLQETGLSSQPLHQEVTQILPQSMFYFDLTPNGVNLGYKATRSQQLVIKSLGEGTPLQMRSNRYGNGWIILTQSNLEIGALSKKANNELIKKGIQPNTFDFLPGEVTVKSIYHHFNLDEVTNEITDEWFVVIPQIRVCR